MESKRNWYFVIDSETSETLATTYKEDIAKLIKDNYSGKAEINVTVRIWER